MSGLSLQTTGGVSSRFVSETDLDAAKATRDEEWKAAYERLGQAPPPREEEEVYDPRSLFEKLQQKKDIKREENDERMKMSNQFRGLDEEEIGFLTDHKNRSEREARLRKLEEDAVLDQFRNARRRSPTPPGGARFLLSSTNPDPVASNSASTSSLPLPKIKAPKAKKGIAGVVVKKKGKSASAAAASAAMAKAGESSLSQGRKRELETAEEKLEDGEEADGGKKARIS